MEEVVVIVGAGPSGIAIAACLTDLSIPYLILEREDCSASLWKKRTYNRLKLHLAKEFCSLPFVPHPPTSPTFLPKDAFIQYLNDYVSHFNIQPHYCRSVISASYDEVKKKWWIEATNTISSATEVYVAEFLVVASGENNEGFIPELPGLDSFGGEIIHSSEYKLGLRYHGKEVLVVGCANSGMEIAYDLSNFGAYASIVVRNPLHVLSKEMVHIGMQLLKFLPICIVDSFITSLAKFEFGNLSKFGIHRPTNGPFYLKATTGRSPVIDVGTIKKIRAREIKVFPAISSLRGNNVIFENGSEKEFDAIIFATGYTSSANSWLKDYKYVLNGNGMPKNSFPNHWKGKNGLYCVGLSRMGLLGISRDAHATANDIKMVLSKRKEKLH